MPQEGAAATGAAGLLAGSAGFLTGAEEAFSAFFFFFGDLPVKTPKYYFFHSLKIYILHFQRRSEFNVGSGGFPHNSVVIFGMETVRRAN